jgi:hypothetical protein
VREYNYSAMSDRNLGREALLELLVQRGRAVGWRGDFDNAWADWDVKLEGDFWHDVTIRTATEELGWPRRFTRCRCATELTTSAKVLSTTIVVWAGAAVASGKLWAVAGAFVAAVVCLLNLWRSRRDCLAATAALIESCALDAGLATQDQNRGASASSAVRRRPKATFVKVVNSLKKKSRRRWRVAVGK